MLRSSTPLLRLMMAAAVLAPPLSAQSADTSTRTTVAPAPRYDRGWVHRLIFGTKYRSAWKAPIDVDVLDLDRQGGGLTPLSQGGFGQTVTLAFDSREGSGYIFRSLDKRRAQGLEENFRGTIVEWIVQDQTSSQLPGASMVAAVLVDAAGLLHTNPRLVVLPDDARLEPFREEFAGMLGTIEELARSGPEGTEGFGGSTHIVGTAEFLTEIEESPEDRLDSRKFLAARLVDLLIGDRDRHAGQWRWARYPTRGGFRWEPIPLDRDEAFIALDGIALGIARSRSPKLVRFGDNYPSIRGLTWNAWDLDRHLLVDLDRSTWDSVTVATRARITDAVIDQAVGELPAPIHAEIGAEIASALKRRRDRLEDASRAFYDIVTTYVDVYATDRAEQVSIDHDQDGSVTVTMQRPGRAEPFFRRRFVPDETKEIRLYLRDGNDQLTVRGRTQKRIRVHAVGGSGSDLLADSSSSRGTPTWFHDGQGENTIRAGSGTRVDGRTYQRPPSPEPFHRFAVDWGSRRNGASTFDFNSDHGVIFLPGLQWTHYAFRKDPYRSRQTVRVGVSASRRFLASYVNHLPNVLTDVDAYLRLSVSGAEKRRFYGFGNETANLPRARARVWQHEYEFTPSLNVRLPHRATLDFGPTLKIVDTDNRAGTVIDSVAPYGEGFFAQTGMRGTFRVDWRDHPLWPTEGLLFEANATLYPPFLDALDAFGSVSGALSGYVTLPGTERFTLAARVAGRQTWGLVPFHEAAYLGGGRSLRGYTTGRFVGESSLFANAEFRFPLAQIFVLMPVDVGGFLLADIGRVFVADESSDVWHGTGGGGIWVAPFHRDYTISLHVARGEVTRFRVRAGFQF